MKKFVAVISIFFCLIFCSCTADTSGYKNELTSKCWSAELEGGAQAELSFNGDTAALSLKSGEETAKIEGRYIADDKTLVIFMPEIAQNYTFEYTPKGNTLELKYNGNAITMSESSYDAENSSKQK